ncbi:MAG: hypothetical protein ABSE58_07340 [Candidatus Limnocylindrales bacterium]|jgi:hypothetical protein
MADETPKTAPETTSAEPSRSKSTYRAAAPSASAVDSRSNGGSGVQRSHLRNRKAWLKGRSRAGQTWTQRKVASVTYCPAKVRAS